MYERTAIAMKATLKTIALGFIATCALGAPAFADRNISWSGQVDDTVIVRIHSDQVRTRAIHGSAPSNVTARVDQPLPDRPVRVWLSGVHGRGTVEVVRQPSAENNYTAVIRLKDAQRGPEYYAFNLNWGYVGRRHRDADDHRRPDPNDHRHPDTDDDR